MRNKKARNDRKEQKSKNRENWFEPKMVFSRIENLLSHNSRREDTR